MIVPHLVDGSRDEYGARPYKYGERFGVRDIEAEGSYTRDNR